MWIRVVLVGVVGLGLALGLGACARDDRQWMKVNTPYTVQEFQRDIAECSRGGKLDDACMRSRGWVDMSSSMEKQEVRPEYKPSSTTTGTQRQLPQR
jgi:hypothetical protein